MIPACSHTGTPNIAFDGFLHFTSSTTSGSACRISARIRASVSPRQSLSCLIRASINREGASAALAWFAPLFFMGFVAFVMLIRSHLFAGQLAGLLHPGGELGFIERIVLVDVEVAHVLVLGREIGRASC